MTGEQSGLHDRVIEMAEDLGRLRSELQGKAVSLGLQAGEIPMSMEEAILVLEGGMDRERLVRIMDYWNAEERVRGEGGRDECHPGGVEPDAE